MCNIMIRTTHTIPVKQRIFLPTTSLIPNLPINPCICLVLVSIPFNTPLLYPKPPRLDQISQGRTGRIGNHGWATSFYATGPEDFKEMIGPAGFGIL